MNILQLCSRELLVLMQWSREVLDSLTQMQMDCITHCTTEYRGVDIENWEYVQHVGVEIFRTECVCTIGCPGYP